MSIPTRLSSYLDQRDTEYDVRTHQLSRTSAETARSAHIQPHQLAKSVVLEDEDGCIVAVLPADATVKLSELASLLDRKSLKLSKENRIGEIFTDCDRGAVPAIGMAWGVETIVDDGLGASEEVFMESGDHERLLRMSGGQFQQLMRDQRHGHFCQQTLH